MDVPATFFVTKSLQPKKAVLDVEARNVVVSALGFAVQKKRIYLRAFVVMPDHWHALFALCEPWTLPKFMQAMVSFVAGKTARNLRHYQTRWQDSYYDTRIKTARQFAYVASYIEQNPVAKGLVTEAAAWDASSAARADLVTEPWPWMWIED
jgi:REP element-mobilizing transposase RayT